MRKLRAEASPWITAKAKAKAKAKAEAAATETAGPSLRSEGWRLVCGRGGGEHAVEGGAADAEQAGGADFVAVDAGEHQGDMAKDGAVEIGVVEEGFRGVGEGNVSGPVEAGQVDGSNPLTGGFERGGGDDGFEFADIAGPGVGGEAIEGAGSEAAEGLPVARDPLAQEEGGEHGNIVAAFAQRGKGKADGGEMTGEIGAEGAGSSEAAQGLRGSGDVLEGTGGGVNAHALVSGAFEEVAELVLLVGREFVDAGEVEEAAAGFAPQGGAILQ